LGQVRLLGLGDIESPSKGSGWTGKAGWMKATVRIGQNVWPDHELLAMDDLPDISTAVGQKVDGILGEDVLKNFALIEIDFKHRCLLLLH
jgi:hypothetical protein